MTLYSDDRAVIAHAEEIAGKATKRKSRKVWLLAGAGTLLAGGGVAFAAMLISSNTASATVAAGTASPVEITQPAFSGKLYPGTSVDLTAVVHNPNPFPVTLSSIKMEGTPTITCASEQEKSMLSGPMGSASTVALGDDKVDLQPGEYGHLTLHKAIKLDKAATAGCGLTVSFSLSGTGAGTGN
jgi:hypothetical protein